MTADAHPPAAKASAPGAKSLFARFSAPVVLVVALAVNLWNLASVPFHPDEATWIFMSRDLALMAREGPRAVCWQPGTAADPAALERARTAPLPRHILGLERLAGILPAAAVPVDWDWTTTWAVNAERGAVPSAAVLLAARLPMALLTSLAALLVFLIARRIGGAGAGLAAAALFIFNALMLLHGRRAMSEAALVFGV
ncbi:MAG: phospholipid carrier-dependent glycosyltransferase, partial [Chloroflexi bacterium]|nr:phospholipid carrier-dependent glycosyltransferase [Chloroflexota bacterium]